MKTDGTDWTTDVDVRGEGRGGGEERAATRTPEFANIERGRNVTEERIEYKKVTTTALVKMTYWRLGRRPRPRGAGAKQEGESERELVNIFAGTAANFPLNQGVSILN